MEYSWPRFSSLSSALPSGNCMELPQSGHDYFLPDRFQFAMYKSSYHTHCVAGNANEVKRVFSVESEDVKPFPKFYAPSRVEAGLQSACERTGLLLALFDGRKQECYWSDTSSSLTENQSPGTEKKVSFKQAYVWKRPDDDLLGFCAVQKMSVPT